MCAGGILYPPSSQGKIAEINADSEAISLEIAGYLLKLLQGGLGNLAAYLAAHVLLCLVPAFFIAGAMTALISKESVTRFLGRNAPKYVSYPAAALAFLFILVALLLSGTLKIGLLTNSYGRLTLPISGLERFQAFLFRLVPFDAGKGQEGVTVQGAILIGLLFLVAFSSWRGLGKIFEGFSRWTWASFGLIVLTLLVASVGMKPQAGGLDILFTGKMFGVILSMILLGYIAYNRAEYPPGESGGCPLRRVHVLPDIGRGADR